MPRPDDDDVGLSPLELRLALRESCRAIGDLGTMAILFEDGLPRAPIVGPCTHVQYAVDGSKVRPWGTGTSYGP